MLQETLTVVAGVALGGALLLAGLVRARAARPFVEDAKDPEELMSPEQGDERVALRLHRGVAVRYRKWVAPSSAEFGSFAVPEKTLSFVLVHGSLGNAATYFKLAPRLLRPNCHVYALDLPGSGLSDKPLSEAEYSPRALGEAVAAFVLQLDLRNVVLVGHSAGGVVVTHAAWLLKQVEDKQGKRVTSLVLVAPGFKRHKPAIMTWLPASLRILLARKMLSPDTRREALIKTHTKPTFVTDELVGQFLAPTHTKNATEAVAAWIGAPNDDAHVTEGDYHTLIAETLPRTNALVVWGDSDQVNLTEWADAVMASSEAGIQEGEQGLCRTRLVKIPECGHYVQHEAPKQLADEILQHVAQASSLLAGSSIGTSTAGGITMRMAAVGRPHVDLSYDTTDGGSARASGGTGAATTADAVAGQF